MNPIRRLLLNIAVAAVCLVLTLGMTRGGDLRSSVVQIRTEQSTCKVDQWGRKYNCSIITGQANGFCVAINNTEMQVVTNEHVIRGVNKIILTSKEGHAVYATVIAADQASDVAILRSQPARGTKPLAVAYTRAPLLSVVTIGGYWPGHGYQQLTCNVINEGDSGYQWLSKPTIQGVSGSPVVDQNGDVIGIVHGSAVNEPKGVIVTAEAIRALASKHRLAKPSSLRIKQRLRATIPTSPGYNISTQGRIANARQCDCVTRLQNLERELQSLKAQLALPSVSESVVNEMQLKLSELDEQMEFLEDHERTLGEHSQLLEALKKRPVQLIGPDGEVIAEVIKKPGEAIKIIERVIVQEAAVADEQ